MSLVAILILVLIVVAGVIAAYQIIRTSGRDWNAVAVLLVTIALAIWRLQ